MCDSLSFLYLPFCLLLQPFRNSRRIHHYSIQSGAGILRTAEYRCLRALPRCTRQLYIRVKDTAAGTSAASSVCNGIEKSVIPVGFCPLYIVLDTRKGYRESGKDLHVRHYDLARPRPRSNYGSETGLCLAPEFAEILEESDMWSCGHALAKPYVRRSWKPARKQASSYA